MKDPYLILGLPRDNAALSDDAVQTAYLALVRRYPPDRHPEKFQQVRRAFETLETEKKRLSFELFEAALPDRDDLITVAFRDQGKPCQRPDLNTLKALLR
ncbi:MAG TPA: molecular chaperone DnaJ [Gammaproteobacteria bacterium]|nr:molecular chaperone DnaJ [Gammaproteobacteria bacterium]